MDGYGYQWRVNPMCCRAQADAAAENSGACPSVKWFWIATAVVFAGALLLPARPKGGLF